MIDNKLRLLLVLGLFVLSSALFSCGGVDDDDDSGDGDDDDNDDDEPATPCENFCTLISECGFETLLHLAALDDCLPYCEQELPEALRDCALDEESDCEQAWSCFEVEGYGPSFGPGPDCELPPLKCKGTPEYCGELIRFDPTEGDGYIDYPENGETENNQYRSWLRREVVMAIQYAAARVRCYSADWRYGNYDPIGLVDMSEEDGSIPGTSDGYPDHPDGTHTDGPDIDVAYYQKNTEDNRVRVICEHKKGVVDAQHCLKTPHLLDQWRQALFIGSLFEHPLLRVIGCDGKAGPILDEALADLCDRGWLTDFACRANKLAYEETDGGLGWFKHHHHHIHVSFKIKAPGPNTMSIYHE